MDRYTIQMCDKNNHRSAVIDLLFTLKEALLLNERATVEKGAEWAFLGPAAARPPIRG